MSDTTESRRKFLKIALVSAGAVMGTLGASVFAPGEEVRIGRRLTSTGTAEAAGQCSSASNCAGGGGKCSSASNCAGS